jgi:hypothetical protein
MGCSNLPPAETLRQLLDYDPATGRLTWKERPVSMFAPTKFREGIRSAGWAQRAWNTRYAGKPAFNCPHGSGHLCGSLGADGFAAHRVAWTIYYGRPPVGGIDHINGDGTDNRIENLREASNLENSRNQGVRFDSTTGHTGVCWHKARSKWVAQIGVAGRTIHLGLFNNKADAVAARKAAEQKHGFHPNHGQRLSSWKPERHLQDDGSEI